MHEYKNKIGKAGHFDDHSERAVSNKTMKISQEIKKRLNSLEFLTLNNGRLDKFGNRYFLKDAEIPDSRIKKFISVRYLPRSSNAWEFRFAFEHVELRAKYESIFNNANVGKKPAAELLLVDKVPYWCSFVMNKDFSPNVTSVANNPTELDEFFKTTFADYYKIIESTRDEAALLEIYLTEAAPFGIVQTGAFLRFCEILHLVAKLGCDEGRAMAYIDRYFVYLISNFYGCYADRNFFKATLEALRKNA